MTTNMNPLGKVSTPTNKPARTPRDNWLTSAETTIKGQQRHSIHVPDTLHEAGDSYVLVPKETRSDVTPGR